MKVVKSRVDTRVCWDCPGLYKCHDRHHTILEGQKYPQKHGSPHCPARCKFMIFNIDGSVNVVWTETEGKPVL